MTPFLAASSGCCGGAAPAWACTTSLPEWSTCSPGGRAKGSHVEHGGRKDGLRERYAGWSPEVPELIEGMLEEDIHQTDIYDRPPAKRCGEGRVTLAGDARTR